MPAIRMLGVLTLLCGLVYPLVMTGVAAVLFPEKAKGSRIIRQGRVVGSELIGRWFDDPKFFWPRPAATPEFPYNAAFSSGSNLGPLHPDRQKLMAERHAALQASDPGNPTAIPADLLTASASGLDPHISPEAARWQAARVAKLRGLRRERVDALIARHTQLLWLGILGEPGVNVLLLNLDLDQEKETDLGAEPPQSR